MDDYDVRERVVRLERLLERLESLDPAAQAAAIEAVQALVELYGEGLERIATHTGRHGTDALREALTADELVSHLLTLHDLHPEESEAEGGFVPRSELAVNPAATG